MKYIIIIPDGMADFPIPELGNKTPMEYAYIPNMHYLAKNGVVGKMQTSFENLPVGSIVANMSILGFNPYKYYPNGRASFEALAQGISLNEKDIAFRCNLISLDDKGKITDFTADNISDGNAKNIVSHYKTNNKNIKIFPGQSYRNILIYRNANVKSEEIKTFEPHMNVGENYEEKLPEGKSENSTLIAKELTEQIQQSKIQLEKLNKYHKTKGDMFWIWSPSSAPTLPNFFDRYKITGTIVAAMDFLKGIGVSSNMNFEDIPDTNGYLDTNYDNKLKYAIKALETDDFVYIHINAPDEEGHSKNAKNKVKAIENIDNKIVAPLMLHLREKYEDNFRIAIMPDHYTAVKDGKHYDFDVPFLIYGKNITTDSSTEFTEKEAKNKDSKVIAYEFLKKHFLI